MSDIQVTGAGAVCLVLARGVGSSGRGEHSRGVVLIREACMALSMGDLGVHAALSRNLDTYREPAIGEEDAGG